MSQINFFTISAEVRTHKLQFSMVGGGLFRTNILRIFFSRPHSFCYKVIHVAIESWFFMFYWNTKIRNQEKKYLDRNVHFSIALKITSEKWVWIVCFVFRRIWAWEMPLVSTRFLIRKPYSFNQTNQTNSTTIE